MNEQQAGIRFSVIIPAYNATATICRALDSVLEQSHPAFEIFVVDDASTDETKALINEKYAGRVIVLEKLFNGGSSIARNTGWDAATGDYVAFLDADDAWHRDKLNVLNTILSAKKDIELFYHPFTQQPILDKVIPENIVLFRLPFVKLLPGNQVATSCLIARNRADFRFDVTMRYTEDYDFCLRNGYKNKLYFIEIPLTQIYRQFTTRGGISANRWAMRKGEMRAYSKLPRQNPLFILLLPFLWIGSLGKHIYKTMVKSENAS